MTDLDRRERDRRRDHAYRTRRRETAAPASRRSAFVLVLALVVVTLVALIAARPSHPGVPHHRVVGTGQIRFDGHGPEWWAARWRREHERADLLARRLRSERRVLLNSPHVVEAINLACATFGSCSTLWRKARCESTLNPRAKNRRSPASGLFQFMPSTFASTPYGRLSIWSPYANALAAGWMHEHGRGGEWVCR